MIRGKYLDPKADLTFKKIFGEHKHLVKSLLNALLPLNDDERIESIEYWPADKIPDRTTVEKYSIVDVCCKDNYGREFIVEMQMSWTESFKKRVLLNASKAYVAQTNRGMNFADLQPVYALNFVNDIFMPDVEDYYHYYHLVHDKYTDKVIEGLHLIFVELPKFKIHTFAERRMQVLWLRFLTEIDENTREAPAELLANEDVYEALEIVERAAFSDDEMYFYDKFWDRVSVEKTMEDEWKVKMDALAEAERRVADATNMIAVAENKAAEAERRVADATNMIAVAENKAAEAENKAAEAENKAAEAENKAAEAENKAAEAENKAAEAVNKAAEAKAAMEQAEAKAKKTAGNLLKTARMLKSMKLSVEEIAEATGLTPAEVEAL